MLLLQGGCSIRALMKLLTRACDYFFSSFCFLFVTKVDFTQRHFFGMMLASGTEGACFIEHCHVFVFDFSKETFDVKTSKTRNCYKFA